MSGFIEKLRTLIVAGDVRISEHGYDELADDGLTAREVLVGTREAVIFKEYPDYPKGSLRTASAEGPVGSAYSCGMGYP